MRTIPDIVSCDRSSRLRLLRGRIERRAVFSGSAALG